MSSATSRLGLDFTVMYLYVLVHYSSIPMERTFCFSHILIGSYGFYNYGFHTEYNLIAELNVLILLSEMITTNLSIMEDQF